MKKNYINPEVKVSKINTCCDMLTTSKMQTKGDYNSGSITIGAKERDEENESNTWSDGGLW